MIAVLIVIGLILLAWYLSWWLKPLPHEVRSPAEKQKLREEKEKAKAKHKAFMKAADSYTEQRFYREQECLKTKPMGHVWDSSGRVCKLCGALRKNYF